MIVTLEYLIIVGFGITVLGKHFLHISAQWTGTQCLDYILGNEQNRRKTDAAKFAFMKHQLSD